MRRRSLLTETAQEDLKDHKDDDSPGPLQQQQRQAIAQLSEVRRHDCLQDDRTVDYELLV